MTQLVQRLKKWTAMLTAVMMLLSSTNVVAIAEYVPDTPVEFSLTGSYDTIRIVYHVNFPGYKGVAADTSTTLADNYKYKKDVASITLERSSNTSLSGIFDPLKATGLGFCGWSLEPMDGPVTYYTADALSKSSPQPESAEIWRGSCTVLPSYFPDGLATIENNVKTVELYGVWNYPAGVYGSDTDQHTFTINYYLNFPGDDVDTTDDEPDFATFITKDYTVTGNGDIQLLASKDAGELSVLSSTTYLNFGGWSRSPLSSALASNATVASKGTRWNDGAAVNIGELDFRGKYELNLYGVWKKDSGAMVGNGGIKMSPGWHDGCYAGEHCYPDGNSTYPIAHWELQLDGSYAVVLPDDEFPARDGYTMVGWGLHRQTADGELLGTRVAGGTLFTTTNSGSNLNYFAIYRKSITFVSEEDGWSYTVSGLQYQGSDNDHANNVGYLLQYPDVTGLKLGEDRVLKGWESDQSKVEGKSLLNGKVITQGQKNVLVKGDTVMKAVWEKRAPLTCNITYHTGLDSTVAVANMPAQQTVNNGEQAAVSANVPITAGQAFKGWATTAGGAVAYQAGDTIANVTNNVDLYAVWQARGAVTVGLQATNTTFTYNGTEQTLVAPTVTGDGAVTWEMLSAAGAILSNAVGTDAADYTATISDGPSILTVNGQVYDITYPTDSLTVTIQPAPLALEVPATLSANYNGQTHGLALADVSTNDLVNGHRLTAITTDNAGGYLATDYTINVNGVTVLDAADNDVTRNYTLAPSNACTLTVAPLALNLVVDQNSKAWDGTALYSSYQQPTTLAATDTLSNVVLSVESITDVSSSNVTINSYSLTHAGDDADVSGCYTVTVTPGSIEVTTTAFDINYHSNLADGVAVADMPATQNLTNMPGAATLSANVPTTAGQTFQGWATAAGGAVEYAAGAAIANVTANMDLYAVWVQNGTMAVALAPQTVVYNGAVQALAAPTVTSDDATITWDALSAAGAAVTGGEGTDTNTYTGTVTGPAIYTSASGNVYDVTYTGADLTIDQAPLTVTPPASSNYVYDGLNHTFSLADVSSSGLVAGHSLTAFTTDASNYVAGDYQIGLSGVTVEDANGVNVTGNYAVSYGAPGTVSIARRALNLVVTQESKVYDGNPIYASYVGTGLAATDALTGVTLNGDGITEPGTSEVSIAAYSVTHSAANTRNAAQDVTNCYDITVSSGSVEITANNTTYTVNYYFDGALDNAVTYSGSGTVGQTIATVPSRLREGMRFASSNAPLVLTEDEGTNVIEVYYTTVDTTQIIADVETPLAGSMMSVTTGDTPE